jgi:hypothetical protein
MILQEAQNKLKQSIEECKEVIKFGSQMSNSNEGGTVYTEYLEGIFVIAAFHLQFLFLFSFFHQELSKLTQHRDQPKDHIGRISVDLPLFIFTAIESHGKGGERC